MSGPNDVPEAAPRRLQSGSFSSGLTVPDFAACLQMGLRPVGLVQGFCAMQRGWMGSSFQPGGTWYGQAPGYVQNWYCPHGFVSAEHRSWGQNCQQTAVEEAWLTGFGSAFGRLIEEAKKVGAHGVIGVTDTSHHLADMNVVEFHILGTAVVVEAGPPPPGGDPWSTYLAGQRLAKLIEAGYMPISVVAAIASVRVFAYCMTEYLMDGGTPYGWASQMRGPATRDIDQVSEGRMAARDLARRHARSQLGSDSLHGVSIRSTERELGAGDQLLECAVRGTRVRRFKDFDPMPPPRPTVRLS